MEYVRGLLNRNRSTYAIAAIVALSGLVRVFGLSNASYGLDDETMWFIAVNAIRRWWQALGAERYDLIVSNPPYVAARELASPPP